VSCRVLGGFVVLSNRRRRHRERSYLKMNIRDDDGKAHRRRVLGRDTIVVPTK
jgi:hypothetical protein